ncbi:MAG: PilZ domain-containing protein [Candidatus Sulfopaludibacter sp.]|nr:PilZ domain-containing protein [Candidatus Sulfopaludibacter sp.]
MMPINRRAADRYVLRMSLQYRTVGQWLPGYTIDISSRGLLLDVPDSLPAGSRLEVVMDWPGIYFGRKTVRLFLIGTVARVDARGTAVRMVRHEFREVAAKRKAAAVPTTIAARSAPMGA